MSDQKKWNSMFAKILNRDGAVKVARDCGAAFLLLAAIQAAASFLLGFSMLLDAVLYAICGYFIRSKHSRVAAVIALLLALIGLVVTAQNMVGQHRRGGSNIVLALILAWTAVRSIDATFKIHGRFSTNVPA